MLWDNQSWNQTTFDELRFGQNYNAVAPDPVGGADTFTSTSGKQHHNAPPPDDRIYAHWSGTAISRRRWMMTGI